MLPVLPDWINIHSSQYGAVMEAEVIIATVPLPWTSLTKVATKNGKSMAGRPVPAMSFAT